MIAPKIAPAGGGRAMASSGTIWKWLIGVVGALDGMGVLFLIFGSEGTQDAAGRGMQAGFGVIGLLVLVVLIALGWFVRTPFVRVPVLILLLAPAAFIALN